LSRCALARCGNTRSVLLVLMYCLYALHPRLHLHMQFPLALSLRRLSRLRLDALVAQHVDGVLLVVQVPVRLLCMLHCRLT
jgi:hypothetical protein